MSFDPLVRDPVCAEYHRRRINHALDEEDSVFDDPIDESLDATRRRVLEANEDLRGCLEKFTNR